MRRVLPVLLTAIVTAIAAFGQTTTFTRPSEYWAPPGSTFPGKDWEIIAKPEGAGFSAAKLALLRAWLKTQNTTSMMVISGGRVLFSHGNVAEVSKVASVRKSILGMLYGKYVAPESRVLHATVKDLGLDDSEPFLPIEERATLQDLLMARSGVYWKDADRDGPRKGTVAPGTQFSYNNWDYNAAGTAFEKISGKDIYDALETDLAGPLGMQDFDKAKQRKIQVTPEQKLSVHPEYAMYLSTRDLARLGYLMARQGMWNGTQVMPKNWTEYLTTLVTPASEVWPQAMRREFSRGPSRWGYGVMWWVWDEPIGNTSANWGHLTGSYTAMGTDGQYLTVIPGADLVVSHKNSNIDQQPDRNVTMFEYMTILQMLLAARD